MNKFKKIPATAKSIAKRKPVHGVGINDADYITSGCPVYRTWKHMLERCYSSKYRVRKGTYVGCIVSEDWLLFSNFALWYDGNHQEGYQLDKDLMCKGNKIYSESTAMFIPTEVNILIQAAPIRELPQGVSLIKATGKYKAQIEIARRKVHLGCFTDVTPASMAYNTAKNFQITSMMDKYPAIAKYLSNHLLN